MGDPVRVVTLGTGQMGSGISRLLLEKAGVELVGAYARRADRAGMDLGPVIGLDREIGIPISNDLSALAETARPDIAIQATCSRLDDAAGEISLLLSHGVNVISIAEEMAWPAATSPATARELNRLAMDNGVALLGTGVNPGFVLDLLVITLTGVCSGISSITAKRVNDLSPYGPSVLNAQGVGLSPDAFELGIEAGDVVGHFGFQESIHMIAATLDWHVEHIEEQREPIVSNVLRETPFSRVEPGQVAGCRHTAVAYVDGRPVITLIHPQQIHPYLEGVETGDEITIEGSPPVHLAGSPEIHGGQATTALAVNMIPRLLNARPGLYSMADLPVPAAILGDLRRRLHPSGDAL
ncbi:MAG: 2,4-diaminopentanoate dehydrogenase [Candidatus Sedimenticola sp. 6PFRAG7]